MIKELEHTSELEDGLGSIEIHFTAKHENGEATSHPDGPSITIDNFEVERINEVKINDVYLSVKQIEELKKSMIPKLEELLHDNPYLFFDDEATPSVKPSQTLRSQSRFA